MEEDLELYGKRFNWALSIFYIVYLLVEVPSNILLKWIGPRYYLPGLVIGFGAYHPKKMGGAALLWRSGALGGARRLNFSSKGTACSNRLSWRLQ